MSTSPRPPHRVLKPGLAGAGRPGPGWPLHDRHGARALEAERLAAAPAGSLMARAGQAVARLALARWPQAQRVLVLCGPGNNGGDGLVAAHWLHQAGLAVQVLLSRGGDTLPADAQAAWVAAQTAQVPMTVGLEQLGQMAPPDLVIDALLGLGQQRPPEGVMATAIDQLAGWGGTPVLAVDLPTGLDGDTGQALGATAVRADVTLALLSLKPGLFTAAGRDWAGEVWFDPLGPTWGATAHASAWLIDHPAPQGRSARQHAQHKGSFGDLWVVGGDSGMGGAAVLAAEAALTGGAGRVYLSALGQESPSARNELMRRPWREALAAGMARQATVVCGCGGGTAVAELLPALLAQAPRLLLDADALNALAANPDLLIALQARRQAGQATVITPQPLEAARLLGLPGAAAVQADRLRHAQALAERCQAVVVLKGSGTVTAAPGLPPCINGSGNARLASPGTGDVLAGWLGARWSAQDPGAHATLSLAELQACCAAGVWQHGRAAEPPPHQPEGAEARLLPDPGATLPLRAQALIERLAEADGLSA